MSIPFIDHVPTNNVLQREQSERRPLAKFAGGKKKLKKYIRAEE